MNLYERLKPEYRTKLDECKYETLKTNATKILEENIIPYKLTIQEFSDVMVTLDGVGNCFDALVFQNLFKD